MPPSTATRTDWETTPLWYSISRSLVTPHWVFTLVIFSLALWGVALAPTTDWHLTGILLLSLYLGVEGMHDIDLADPTVAVDIDPTVQRTLGYLLVAAGFLVGMYAAYLTTWTLALFFAAETFAGLAYNAEWFDGFFHDLDKFGWGTAAIALGFLPVTLGHYLLAQTLPFAVLLWGAVAATYSVGILHLYQAVKVPVLYDRIGIRHVRTMQLTDAEAYRLVTTGLLCIIFATILTGVAFVTVSVYP